MSRWKAAAIHLSISAVIGIAAAGLIFGLWYPYPYSRAAGALELVVLLLGVDIVLGPLLTLVVYRQGKRGLALDLAVIAVAQLCAFTYGMVVVTDARPAFIVGAIDRFIVVRANDLDPKDLAAAPLPQFQTLPWNGPAFAVAILPGQGDELNDLVFSGAGGKDIERFPKFYVEYPRGKTALLGRAKPLTELLRKHPEAASAIDAWMSRNARADVDVVWLPLQGPRQALTMLLDRHDGSVVGALDVDPW